MRFFMPRAEREITKEVTNAHGGSEEQYARVRRTLGVLPAEVRDEVDDLIGDVFLAPLGDCPWRSPKRLAALDRLRDVLGGYPHAYSAVCQYWPVAKSIRMNGWG